MANTLRWLTLIAAIWLQCMSGTNFTFPAYSAEVKRSLRLSELQLNDLALASDAGKLFGWISGIAAGYLPLWFVLLIGTCLGVIGYGIEYLLLAQKIYSLAYWQTFLLTSLAGNSISWINTVSYIIVIKNFPFHRQIAMGLATSYQGLSAGIFTDIVNVVNLSSPAERAKTYLLLNTIFPLIVCLVAAPVIRDFSDGKYHNISFGLMLMLIITIATGIFAVISSLSSSILPNVPPWFFLGLMGVFLLAPFVVPLVEQVRETMRKIRRMRNPRVWDACADIEYRSDTVILSEQEIQKFDKKTESSPSEEILVREEIGPILMLRRLEFWLYYFVYLFGATLGLVFMNNLGQIVESRGSSRTSALVSLSSSFSFFGRLIPALLDYFLSRNKSNMSRPNLIAALMIPMAGSFFLLYNDNDISLYITTSIICLCSGAIIAISVSTTAELFGTKSFGVNHNILITNIPLGSFLFGDFAAWVYNKEKDRPDGSCNGSRCYQLTFLTWGFLCAFGTFLAIILHLKTRRFYSREDKSIELQECGNY